MKPLDINRDTALPILRALKTIALADGIFESRQREFVEKHQKDFGLDTNLDALAPISPDELAAAIPNSDTRLAIVQRMVIVALLDDEAQAAEIDLLRNFAKTLGVSEPAIKQMKFAATNNTKRLAFDLLRHGFLATVFRNEWKTHGVGGILRGVLAMSGGKNETVAAKFRALQSSAPGTLGAHYCAYMHANRFPLPGEPKGAAEMLIFHDLGHALTGFSTNVPGEMRMAGFEAGYMKNDGFGVVALALFGFHLGIALPNITACRGGFDWSAVSEGYHLGRKLNVDLRNWDPWPYMNRPLEDVRRELGLEA